MSRPMSTKAMAVPMMAQTHGLGPFIVVGAGGAEAGCCPGVELEVAVTMDGIETVLFAWLDKLATMGEKIKLVGPASYALRTGCGGGIALIKVPSRRKMVPYLLLL